MKQIITLFFTLLLIANTAFAFPNEPEGFRDLKWGDSIEQFFKIYPDATFKESKNIIQEHSNKKIVSSVYFTNIENNLISGLTLRKEAAYFFTDQKFSGVMLVSTPIKSGYSFIEKEGNFIENLVSLYGKPSDKKIDTDTNQSKEYSSYIWNSNEKSVIMVLTENNLLPKKDGNIAVVIFNRKDIDTIFRNTLNKKDEAKKQGW